MTKRRLYSVKRNLVNENPERYRYTVAMFYPSGSISTSGLFESKYLAGKELNKLQKMFPETKPKVKIISAGKNRLFIISDKQLKTLKKYRKLHPQKTFRRKAK